MCVKRWMMMILLDIIFIYIFFCKKTLFEWNTVFNARTVVTLSRRSQLKMLSRPGTFLGDKSWVKRSRFCHKPFSVRSCHLFNKRKNIPLFLYANEIIDRLEKIFLYFSLGLIPYTVRPSLHISLLIISIKQN
jgi:hypothetical protein